MMGKHRDYEMDTLDSAAEHPKRHKKHKKHKYTQPDYDSDNIDVLNDEPDDTPEEIHHQNDSNSSPAVDKLTKQSTMLMMMPGSSNSMKTTPPSSSSSSKPNNRKRKGRGKDSGTSSDEERWLDAIESGKLEEVDDELKKIKDPKLMTARQRAMYDRGNDKETSPGGELLMALPSGYKEKVMTAEAIQKAQLKSQKRKQLADEKREKDKKKTMERLLKKQDTKQRAQGKNKILKVALPMITYRNTIEGSLICLPMDHEFPLRAQTPRDPPKPIICSIAGCTKIKSYNCSKTNVPLCSFACYKKNVESIKEIF